MSDGADWTSTGRLFQSLGPAAANERSPTLNACIDICKIIITNDRNTCHSVTYCHVDSFAYCVCQSRANVNWRHNFYYFAPGMSAKYCDERVCVSVCSFAYLKNDTSKLHEIFRKCYPYPWLGPPLTKYNMLCTSGFVDDVTFIHNVPHGAWLIRRVLKVTHQGAES